METYVVEVTKQSPLLILVKIRADKGIAALIYEYKSFFFAASKANCIGHVLLIIANKKMIVSSH